MTRPVKRIVQVGAILAVILLLGIWLGTRGTESMTSGGDDAAAPSGMAVPVPNVAVLDSSLRALADGERGSPRDRWDPEWVARRLGGNPDTLLAWVRIHTAWIPYRGALRGAPGVLQDRQGNSLDRALLLASLLEHSGHTVRLAQAEIAADRARTKLPGLAARRRTPHGATTAPRTDESVWRPVVRQVATQYGLDAEGVDRSLSAGVASTDGALGTLEQRVENQFGRLQRLLPAGAASRARMDSAVSALRDHWWVQRFDGERWIDLDPLGWATDSAVTASQTSDVRSLADSMYHRVAVRLVTESWARGGLRERVAFESELRPSELMGLPISLQVWPTEWPAEILPTGSDARGAVRATALTQREWSAVLMVGSEPRAEVVLDVSGEMRHPAAGGPMGGLGRGIVGALGAKSDADVFTAAWLEYETRVPGQEPRRERRVLFDLPGPSVRAAGLTAPPELDDEKRVTRNLALMRQTEILPLGSVPDPGFVLHLAAQAAQANMLLLRTRQADTAGGSPDAFTDVADRIATPPTPLYTLAIARFAWDRRGDVFLDRPNVLSRHLWLRPVAGGAVRAEANDIVLNDVGIAVDVADERAVRLRQGIRDTNGESLFPTGARARESVGEAFATPGDWVVATSASDPALRTLRASADARFRMQEELNAGYVLVVRPPSDEMGADVEGWWRIDPSTGHALGVSRIGWGQTLVERAVKYATIFSAAWAFEYLICRNGLYGLPGEPGARTDGTVGFLLVKTAYAQTQFCSINALIAGILALGQEIASATWPLVLRTIAGRGYSGILSDRPWFATGAGDPGDLPPIFGNRPGSGTPEPECQPGGSASPGQRPSGEPAPPEPGRPAEPAEAPEGTGRPPAGEEGKPAPPREEGMPYYAEDKSGMTPVPPENIDAKIPPASAHADAMERELDNAVINHQEAVKTSAEADAALARARAAFDQAERDFAYESPERKQAAEAWSAANREAFDKFKAVDLAAKQVRRAQYNSEGARDRVSYLRRLAEANRAAYQAAQARNEATTAWERTGMTDYNSPEYARFRDANERFRAAQRELSDRFWGQESPARGTDNTVPAPPQPSMPPTERAPAPGGNAPGGSPAPAGCGGGPASPAAESVVGVVGAGAGAVGGN